ncbi:HVO_0758 family zinc finger protein [Halobaculum sp. MBLA0147]|uniref:HVO_0758 family zinc finger protein n=1 Tax=Halobaculum sp. MBLA0147 TaxID=3079934 RepID=UPI0035240FD1
MKSVRRGLRDGDLEKDNYERLQCGTCGADLSTEDDPDEVYTVRVCPECGDEYKELG